MGVRKTNCRGRLTRSGTIAGSLPQLANMLTIQELQTWKRTTRINIVPDKKLAYLFGEPLVSKGVMGSPTENQDVAGLHKTPTGIEGFDLITGGGLPLNRTTLLLGGPGSGKTVFALQTLVNGAPQSAEPGIFVASEENSRHILANAASFSWKLPELEKKQLLFVDAKMRPDVIKAGEFDLSGMLAGIKAGAAARGARRIVFDAIDVLLTLLDDRSAE